MSNANEHPQIGDWRAQGRDDALKLYDKLTAKNDAAKQKIVDAVNSMLDLIDTDIGLQSVAASERTRLREQIAGIRGVVRSTDLSPHPARVNLLLEASSARKG